MRIVDTSAWIEWFIDSLTGRIVRPNVPSADTFLVPTIVQFELAKWLAREAPEKVEDVIGFTRKCVVGPLDTEVALRASRIASEHRLAIADSIIYATALAYDADVLTCDAHFEGLPQVLYVPKVPQS